VLALLAEGESPHSEDLLSAKSSSAGHPCLMATPVLWPPDAVNRSLPAAQLHIENTLSTLSERLEP